jgi:hypothetical protein
VTCCRPWRSSRMYATGRKRAPAPMSALGGKGLDTDVSVYYPHIASETRSRSSRCAVRRPPTRSMANTDPGRTQRTKPVPLAAVISFAKLGLATRPSNCRSTVTLQPKIGCACATERSDCGADGWACDLVETASCRSGAEQPRITGVRSERRPTRCDRIHFIATSPLKTTRFHSQGFKSEQVTRSSGCAAMRRKQP